MMPLLMVDPGKTYEIKRIGGESAQRKFIESLGFIQGGDVSVLSKSGENIIVSVKGARVAINKDVALKILV